MSRGLHAKYQLLEIKNEAAYYAYGGSNFSYDYDKDIFEACDGRIKIMLCVFSGSMGIEEAFKCKYIELIKPCYYAEENIYGFDIFALKTIKKIISAYLEKQEIPETGFWVC